MQIRIEPYNPDPRYDSDLSPGRWHWSVQRGSTYSGVEATELDAWRQANATVGRVSPLLPYYGVSNYNKMEARALAAEREVARLRAAWAEAVAEVAAMGTEPDLGGLALTPRRSPATMKALREVARMLAEAQPAEVADV